MYSKEENQIPGISLVKERIAKVSLGDPATHGQMAIYPLLDKEDKVSDYLTLDESITNGYAHVTEIDESGNIPELKFKNSSDKQIFLMEGEELVGAKQNRTLNLSVLAPAEKEIIIPVSCVESGRWSYESERFDSSDRVHFSKGRREKMESVSYSMCSNGSAHADQRAVWEEISAKESRMRNFSPTSSMGDIFENYKERLSDYVKAFSEIPNQQGMLVMVGDEIIGLDLFGNKKTLKKLMPKLVKSFALDAIELNTNESYQPKFEFAKDLLEKTTTAITSFHSGIGHGVNLRLQNETVIGGALALDNQVIHLSVFRKEGPNRSRSYRRDRESGVRRASRRRGYRRSA